MTSNSPKEKGLECLAEIMGCSDFYLDSIYEAETFVWMLQNIWYQNAKTLFWVVGNANYYR